MEKKERKLLFREKSITATVLLITVTAIIFVAAYIKIDHIIQERCLQRMDEGVHTVIDAITNRLNRDARIMNAAASLFANLDSFEPEVVMGEITAIAPILEARHIRVLLPDNTIITSDGMVFDGTDYVSYEVEAPLGEHVSNRMISVIDGSTPIYRHFVPIIQNGETVAMLYGVTVLADLPSSMNIDNIYNGTANAYIIDTETGDLLMDTLHPEMHNVSDFSHYRVQDGSTWDSQYEKIRAGETGYFVFYSETLEGWQYFYYTPAGINQWAIAVSVPEISAFASLYAIQKVCIILAVLMAITITVYYLWVIKNARDTMEKTLEKALLEERLHKAEAAERAKTTFLSNMSHDIRTPMNAIIGFTTLAQTNIDHKERVQEYLAKITSASNHLLSLINDILDMSRIESGRLNIEEKECSISDIFRDMRNIILTQMQAKQLNFFMDTIDVVDEDIYCDKLHVNQVLLNLLSNAIKFTPAGGSVSLTVRQLNDAPTGYGSYEICVKDTGIGMSEEFSRHIFEPFERERTSTVSGIQGTGLGMAITKSIVDAMGGTIHLETEQGKGTEFVIQLEFRLQSERKPVEVIRELRGLRALVVDDSFNTCDSVTKMLAQIGMRSEWTLHGKEAVLRARQAKEMGDEFCAYVIDWALPDLNGLEVTRQIRREVGDDIPIIILTAYDWSVFEDEARSAGVTAFCNKPIFLSELRDTLVSAIDTTSGGSAAESVIPETSENLKGKRLLLVEDIDLNREIADAILTESGFVVESAENGQIAVDTVRNSQPGYYDLILMDIQMPVMNGYDAARAIRALDDPSLAGIPIVAMTANAFDEDRKAALDSGMNAHVAKPIDVEELIDVLQKLLSKKNA